MTSQKIGVSGERYQLVERLQQGATGRVFLGKRVSDGEIVAIKILFKTFAKGELPQEVQNCLLLQNTEVNGIVKMLDYCIDERPNQRIKVAIIFEYVPVDLYEHIQDCGLKEVEIKQIVKTVITTLLDMHSKAGKMHMDVKEENVLINPQTNEVKLCDFDILASTYHLFEKTALGTKALMAPETVKKNQFFPTRSITWNVGLMTYSLLNDIFRPWEKYIDHDIKKLIYDSEVSTLAMNFVEFCLVKDVFARPDLITLLEHPWFSKDSNVNSK